jgi:hypothetical protein
LSGVVLVIDAYHGCASTTGGNLFSWGGAPATGQPGEALVPTAVFFD